ncbi:hypothetical protein FEM03_21335 [Phragmitibacter flavus]|uniref:DUF5667 domain-containing protein n=1 Tax=Phragmitibacter flavus TaxID=2576071 RepID=A0A5R8K8S5_9BACT|nr:hypothetical protein [Phragmitibacter flavus]TLD68727.1 hypothetical protein FEM03_21335 [Phragmitibacter flavus]
MRCCLLLGLLIVLCRGVCLAAEVDPDAWVTRSFWMPGGMVSVEAGWGDETGRLVELPRKGASEGEWVSVLRMHTEWMKRQLGGGLVSFPEGTVLVYDRKSDTLAMRSTVAGMQWAETLEKSALDKVQRSLVFRLEVVEGDAGMIQEMVSEAADLREHGEIWKRLEGLIKEEKLLVRETSRLEVKSGQRGVLETGKRLTEFVSVSVDAEGRMELVEEERRAGMRLEVDPVLRPDLNQVDVNYVWSDDDAPSAKRMKILRSKPGDLGIEMPVLDGSGVSVTTTGTFLDGDVRLVGVWSVGVVARRMRAAFLKCEVVPLFAKKADERLEEGLKKYADLVEIIPVEKKSGVDGGLKVRVFSVPGDFLIQHVMVGEDGTPVDPFSNTPTKRVFSSAREVLEGWGIQFPEGAEAVFSAASGTLWVKNTEETLEAIEMYVGHPRKRPLTLSATVRVVQGDSALVRELMGRMGESGDHSALWEEVQVGMKEGKFSAVDAMRLECRSGQRAVFKSGMEFGDFPSLKFEEEVRQDGKEVETDGERKGVMKSKLETGWAGMCFEMDPLLGPDGFTMDLNLAFEFHHAPPDWDEASGGWEFRCFETTTSLTVESGSQRVIGVWKPEGVLGDVLQVAFLKMVRVGGE